MRVITAILDIREVKTMNNPDLFGDYENAKLLGAEEYAALHAEQTYPVKALPSLEVKGIPICVRRDAKGVLRATFIPDTHVLAIGATRSGKTTGYVIPTMNVLLSRKNKPSMVISDPKQELYRACGRKFEKAGYRVLMLDFTDYRHSDCWNPLTKCFRFYRQYLQVESSVKVKLTPKGPKNVFEGTVYDSQQELDRAILYAKECFLDEVEKALEGVCRSVIPTMKSKDPFWEDSARALLKAILYGMLEDSESGAVTEDTFSFDTVMRIFNSFTDSENDYDGGYFTKRPKERSKAY